MLSSVLIKVKQISYIGIHLRSKFMQYYSHKSVKDRIFSHNLITSKSSLAKKDLSKPRLKLEVAHMSTNLAENDKTF